MPTETNEPNQTPPEEVALIDPTSTGTEQPAAPAAEPDMLLAAILRDLKGEPSAAEPAQIEPAELEPVVDDSAVLTQEPVTAPTPEKRKAVKSFTKGHYLVDGPPPPSHPTSTAPSPPQQDMTRFNNRQREELEDAMVAERLFPDRYAGHAESLKRWYYNFETRAQALRNENPNIEEDDDQYVSLLKSKPALSQPDFINVAAKKATDRQIAELTPTINRLKMESKRASIQPQVADYVRNNFTKQIGNLVSSDANSVLSDAHKFSLEKGSEAAAEEFPLEVGMMREAVGNHMRLAEEFLMLRNGASEFDAANQTHSQIADFINREGQSFAERGGKYLRQANRTFIPRSQFISMLSQDRTEGATFDATKWQTQRYWTFTDSTIIDMMAVRTKESAERSIESVRENAKKYGFEKAPKKQVGNMQSQPSKVPTELRPPQSRPGSSPGAATTPKTAAVIDNSPVPLSSLVSHLRMVK